MTETIAKPKLEELEPKAKALLEALKVKHKDSATPRALEDAAKSAYAIWRKAASENTLTGAVQLDDASGVSSMERYFLARMPRK